MEISGISSIGSQFLPDNNVGLNVREYLKTEESLRDAFLANLKSRDPHTYGRVVLRLEGLQKTQQ